MSSEDKKVCFVLFILRDDKPLYIQSFDVDEEDVNSFLKYNFLSHMALDIIASPGSISIREQQQDGDLKNGAVLLVVHDDVTVYGYETNTGLKIIIGFNNQTHLNKSDAQLDLRSLFHSVHKAYVKMICNPFLDISDKPEENESLLQNERFDKSVRAIVTAWNSDS